MKKILKKIGALVLAGAMVAAMSLPAMAAGENTGSSAYKSDKSANNDYAKVDDNTFSIKKEIVLFNVDTSSILDPNVVYSYTVAPVDVTDGTPDVTGIILDDANNPHKLTTAVVKDGIDNAVTIQGRKENAGGAVTGASGATTTITFGGDNTTKHDTKDEGSTVASTDTAVTTGYIDVTVNAATIFAANKGPGIYRYKISDTTTDTTLLQSGIKRDSNYIKDLYLDVYVKNNDNNPVDGYVVYGYVLFKEGATAGANKDLDILYASGTAETVKVDGYTVLSEVALADQYHTYNVEVKKTITGALADKRNKFPFQVDITNVASTISGYTEQVTSQTDFYYVITTGGAAQTEVITNLNNVGAKTIGSASATPADNMQFQDGDNILITGLPVNALVKATEYNNTYDVYTVTAKDEADATLKLDNTNATPTTDAESVTVENAKTALLHAAKAIDYTASKDIVKVTNTIDTISPTGIALRVAPYILMLCAGIAFLVISRRKEEDN